VCTGCSRQKPARAFPKDGTKKDGRAPRCRVCKAAGEQRRYTPRSRPATMPHRQKYGPGDRFAELVIVERLPSSKGYPKALMRCDCGNERELGLFNVVQGRTTNCADRAKHADPRHRGQAVTYDGAHGRVKSLRGSASRYPCAACGGRAEQWAYWHADPDEQCMAHGREKGKPYRASPEQYLPLCRSDHARFDRAHGRLSGGGLSLAHRALWLALQPDEEVSA
jgi:hypothetical protein